MEKFRIEDIEFLFPYGLWLKKEVEKLQTRRGQLVDIGGQVMKCGNKGWNLCDDLIEEKTFVYNEGNTHRLSHGLTCDSPHVIYHLTCKSCGEMWAERILKLKKECGGIRSAKEIQCLITTN